MKKMLILALLIAFSSCYPLPEEDEYSCLPTTNNPSVTRAKTNSMMPNMK